MCPYERGDHVQLSSPSRVDIHMRAVLVFRKVLPCLVSGFRDQGSYASTNRDVLGFGKMLTVMIDSGLVGSTETHLGWCREHIRCSRDTYPESYITTYTSMGRITHLEGVEVGRGGEGAFRARVARLRKSGSAMSAKSAMGRGVERACQQACLT